MPLLTQDVAGTTQTAGRLEENLQSRRRVEHDHLLQPNDGRVRGE